MVNDELHLSMLKWHNIETVMTCNTNLQETVYIIVNTHRDQIIIVIH